MTLTFGILKYIYKKGFVDKRICVPQSKAVLWYHTQKSSTITPYYDFRPVCTTV